MKPANAIPKKVLTQLAIGLDDIINEFDWLGFSDESPDVTAVVEDDDDQMEEDETYETSRTFEREDVEIGVDQLISRMIKKKLIGKEQVGRQPTLSRVFATFYKSSNPILERVRSFEQHIRGYFGSIDYEEMQAAFDDIVEVKKLVEEDLKQANG